MNKKITDATTTLQQIQSVQQTIVKRSAKEYAPWIGWGLYVIIFFSPFDYVKPSIWGPISWLVAAIGGYITYRYFKKHADVKVQRAPWQAWFLYGLWIALGVAVASSVQTHIHYAMTIAGFVVGLPFIAYGIKLKRDLSNE